MSGLTPEVMREAANWLEGRGPITHTASYVTLREEADRLEAAAKTPGQLIAERLGHIWTAMNRQRQKFYEECAADVIAHVVGPTRSIVDKADLEQLTDDESHPGVSAALDRLWKASKS